MDAGLSLGQVARSDISRTAIYFVETGKAKPSMETLRLIADRTGRPLDYFLAETATAPLPAADLAELERLMAVGDNLGAAARTEHLLGQRLDPESEARVKLIAAMAYLRLAQPAAARRYAVAARTYFERTGDRVTAVEALGSEAQAAYLMQDPAALPLAESALEILRTLKSYPQAAQARVLAILAAVHLQNQNWQEAIDKYEEAIAAGDVVQDLRNLSVMYSGLSLAYQESGQINDATRYAQKALTIHETLKREHLPPTIVANDRHHGLAPGPPGMALRSGMVGVGRHDPLLHGEDQVVRGLQRGRRDGRVAAAEPDLERPDGLAESQRRLRRVVEPQRLDLVEQHVRFGKQRFTGGVSLARRGDR